ncbi:unnamed protein product [Paramecium primaurelia]|uniref:Protein kinase domain-containing protein n=1 Tax=Paramecium primaurelia TaxID=5886 RepID=A0A8S1KCR8_PARPR|nr:unnamed protein product [Paramecium primaurelia]
MLLQFQCLRKHLIFDKAYILQCYEREVFIGENKAKPKYYFEVSLKSLIVFHTESDYIGFSIPYRGKLKLFHANSKKIRELKILLSGKVLFGDLNQFYLQKHQLGHGSFSYVNMLQNLETKEMMAAKFLSKHWKHKTNTERMKAIILKLFKGNNKRKQYCIIIESSKYNQNKREIVIIYEFINGDTLEKYLHDHCGSLSHFDVQSIMRQLILTLFYLHQQQFIHRDIKPSNIMIQQNHNIKIIDFGLAAKIGTTNNDICGTIGYIAPEVLCITTQQSVYSFKCDMFAAGAIFYKLITSYDLLKETKDYTNFQLKLDLLKKLNTPESGIDLLQKLLDFNYKTRLSAKEALSHHYFTESLRVSAKKSLQISQQNILLANTSQVSQIGTSETQIQNVNVFTQNLNKRFRFSIQLNN